MRQSTTMAPSKSRPAMMATTKASPNPPTMSEASEALLTSTKCAVPVTFQELPSGMFSSHHASSLSFLT